MIRWHDLKAKLIAAFSAAVVVVFCLVLATWYVVNISNREAFRITETHEMLRDLALTRGYMLQTELATQNFRLTGDSAYLAERDQAAAQRELILSRIEELTREASSQHQLWAELRQITDQRLAISRQIEKIRKMEGEAAATAFTATAPLRATKTRTYEILSSMEAAQRSTLTAREAKYASIRKALVAVEGILAVSLTFALLAAYLQLQSQLRQIAIGQQALTASEESMKATLNSIGDAVLTTDINGYITRFNPVAAKLTGRKVAEAIGHHFSEVLKITEDATQQAIQISITEALQQGGMARKASHLSLMNLSGGKTPVTEIVTPLQDRSGILKGAVLVIRDVSQQRMNERLLQERNAALENDVRLKAEALNESERHLQNIIAAVPVLIAFVGADRRYVYVNEQYRQRFAPERQDITGLTVEEILGPERYAIADPMIREVLAGEPQGYDWQPFPGVWLAIRYVPRFAQDGAVSGYFVLGSDITERKSAEDHIKTLNAELGEHVRDLELVSRALKTLSAGNRAMLRAQTEQELLDGMCNEIVRTGGYSMAIVWLREEGKELAIMPQASCGYLGDRTTLQIVANKLSDTAFGEGLTLTAIRSGTATLARDMQTDPNHAPWWNQPNKPVAGIAYPLHVDHAVIGALTIYDTQTGVFSADEVGLLNELADDLSFGIGSIRARKEQERVKAEMDHLLRFDTLTGLPNAVAFTEAISTMIGDGKTSGQAFAVCQLNVERLGEINEALGVTNGDLILKEFSRRLSSFCPPAALATRLRGDEFGVLLPVTDTEDAVDLARGMANSLSQPYPVADIMLDISCRSGLAIFPYHGQTAEELLRRAGKALYQAKLKDLGLCIFQALPQQDQVDRLNMAGELRRAIEGGQLRFFLQPKVDMTAGRVIGAEALIRWQHPHKGLIPPAAFIGLAEKTGLLNPLTEWLIVAVLDMLKEWQDEGEALPVAINMSARNFRDQQLPDKIRRWQAERQVKTGLLEIEVTESTVMDDPEYAMGVLRSFREDGIPLYVDDFGTGYSSLSYLQKLPCDYIKIDQSFVAAMLVNRDSSVIVKSTIDLVHDLGRKTVAEGVETPEQWNRLKALGCDFAQGYLIARPMPAGDFRQWVVAYHVSLQGQGLKHIA